MRLAVSNRTFLPVGKGFVEGSTKQKKRTLGLSLIPAVCLSSQTRFEYVIAISKLRLVSVPWRLVGAADLVGHQTAEHRTYDHANCGEH